VSEYVAGEASALLAGFVAGSRVAGYQLEGQIGAGGMAVVFRARDERLGRMVALKILAPGLATDASFRQRFIRESRAAAAVDDPHIIPVYEAGEASGVLFIAMRLVRGGDVRSLIYRQGPLPPARVAAIISPVASALDAAHAAGLVHRDVKPANMLVDTRPGRPDHVYLSDFGLSKGAQSSLGLTGSGQFLGTPNYSAPEQIQGRLVDGRTDQYALACVTFEMLTGEAPFERDQGMAVIWAHLSEPPPSLASRRPGLPAAADGVLARALAKEPGERFASGQEFADALREALGLASYDTDLWAARAARDPATAGQPAVGPVTVTALTAAGPVVGATDISDAASGPSSKRYSMVRPGREARRGPGPAAGLSAAEERIVAGVAVSVAFSRDGNTLATGNYDGSTYLWQIATGRVTAILADVDSTSVASVAFSPDGTMLAAGDSGGGTHLWNVASRRQIATLAAASQHAQRAGVASVAFSPDGTTVAAGDSGGATRLWDVATLRVTATLADVDSASVASVAFSPDGTMLAAGGSGGATRLWDVATGRAVAILADLDGAGVASVAFSPDGKVLATGNYNGNTYLWDMATGQVIATLADPGSVGVYSVAFGPDGTSLATGDSGGSTYLWDVATGQVIATLADPGSVGVYSVAFSPDGRTLATSDYDGEIYLWHLG
jgi:eukaryotic-like serine/threonine-protein kinase